MHWRRYGMGAIFAALLMTGCAKKTEQPVIALLTQGNSEIAQLQAAIHSADPDARAISLIPLPSSTSLRQNGYLIDDAVTRFPAGSIFVIATDSLAKHPLILVRTAAKKYYFAPDDGILSYVIAREGLGKIWQLDEGLSGAAGLDYLGSMAGLLADSAKPDVLGGTEIKSMEMLPINVAHVSGRAITGEIAHIDADGTLLTNITEKMTPWMKEENLLRFSVGKENFSAPLVTNVSEVSAGKFAALYNAQGHLQILRNNASAAKKLGAAVGDAVMIRP